MRRSRSQSRRLAAQALYQHALSPAEIADIISQFKTYETWKDLDEDLFFDLVKGTIANLDDLDEIISKVVDRKLDRIDPVEISLLRLGTYELKFMQSVPFKVILNEYINLAKVFGSVESDSYINAALDKIARGLRVSSDV